MLDDWQVPITQALPIAAKASTSAVLTDRALALQAALVRGESLAQAFARDRTFWGQRTLRLLTRDGDNHPGSVFRRLSAGAAEPPLQRVFNSCFGMGWRRRIVSAVACLGIAAPGLPVLPHFEDQAGRFWVVPFPLFPSLALVRDPYATFASGRLRGPDSQWEGFRNLAVLMDTPGIAGDVRPEALRRLPQWLDRPGAVGDQARYIRRLSNAIDDRSLVGCFLEMRRHLYAMTYEVETSVALDRLVVSPVPAIWLQRLHQVRPVRDSLLLTPGDAKQRLRDLAGRCPFMQLLTTIPSAPQPSPDLRGESGGSPPPPAAPSSGVTPRQLPSPGSPKA